MGKDILRDVLFACAGVVMVIALIGLPGPGPASQQTWQYRQTHLLPCYNCTSSQPRVKAPGTGAPPSLSP
jgi:hypothetical protein